MRTRLLLFLVIALVIAACNGGSDSPAPTAAPGGTSSPTPNPTIIASTETPLPADAPSTSTVPPEPTATTAPNPSVGDVAGFPFATADVRAAAEGRGFGFQLLSDRPTLCTAGAVASHAYWSANLAGADSGPLLVLWVYDDPEALEEDWTVEPGSAPAPRFDCELPGGFVYWNENLVMALETWLASGFDVSIGDENPSDQPAIQGFLSLVR